MSHAVLLILFLAGLGDWHPAAEGGCHLKSFIALVYGSIAKENTRKESNFADEEKKFYSSKLRVHLRKYS
jgi:hypothetical protein